MGIANILDISLLSAVGLLFCIGFSGNSFETIFSKILESFTKDVEKDK